MTEGTDALFEKALELSANVPDNFLEFGRKLLPSSTTSTRTLFRQLAAKSNMGLRRAYHLIGVGRNFEALATPHDQLGKIGWPKLQLSHSTLDPEHLGRAAPTRRRMHGERPRTPCRASAEAARQRSIAC